MSAAKDQPAPSEASKTAAVSPQGKRQWQRPTFDVLDYSAIQVAAGRGVADFGTYST
jgi:hypothetical protein